MVQPSKAKTGHKQSYTNIRMLDTVSVINFWDIESIGSRLFIKIRQQRNFKFYDLG